MLGVFFDLCSDLDIKGTKVRETNNETNRLTIMVIGNTLINSPSTPPKNSNGANPRAVVSVPDVLAVAIFLIDTVIASLVFLFFFTSESIDSATITISSTISPRHKTRPNKVMVFSEIPLKKNIPKDKLRVIIIARAAVKPVLKPINIKHTILFGKLKRDC